MSTSIDAHQLSALLRISRELDIIGDVTATVTTPSELLAWAHALPEPIICAWRAKDSNSRYVQVSADCHRKPIHGRITAVLTSDDHHHSPATTTTRSGPRCYPTAIWPPARNNSCRQARWPLPGRPHLPRPPEAPNRRRIARTAPVK